MCGGLAPVGGLVPGAALRRAVGSVCMSRIHAVLLDLDETLLHDRASTDAALLTTTADCCARRGVDPLRLAGAVRGAADDLWVAGPGYEHCRRLGISAMEGMWAAFALGEDADTAGLREFCPRYRRAVWGRALEAVGQVPDRDLCALLAERFVWERASRQIPFAETLPTLVALRAAGAAICVVTNGDRDLQRRKVSDSGLLPFLDHLVISGEIGIGKPEPGIFEYALARCHAAPGVAVMVGDSAGRDVAGAVAAGVRAVWLDRFGAGDRPDGVWRVLPDLRRLPQILFEEG